MGTMKFIILLLFLLVKDGWSLPGIKYNQQNGEYTDVVFAIDESIKEDEALINELKKNLMAASDFLAVATHSQVKFGEIKILIPEKWKMKAEAAVLESFNKADVRIVETNNRAPFVQRIPECGRAGGYMQLSVNFIKNLDQNYGSFDKTFVHEWSHLRWGLFDEYIGNRVRFYVSGTDGSIQLMRCSRNLKYDVYTIHPDGRITPDCRVDPSTNLYDSRCRGSYSPRQAVTASLMNNQHLDAVVEYCDNDPTKPSQLHNTDAPNNQNRICSYRSAWEVMRNHPDFALPVAALSTEPVRFTVLKRQNETLRVVIVMDVSPSMNDNDRITEMHGTVQQFIEEILPVNRTKLGLVKFWGSARKLTPGLVLLSESSRAELARLVPSTITYDATGIGAGLTAALEMLTEDAQGAASSNIIILTDGEENRSPYIRQVIPSLVEEGVQVSSIIFGPGDDALKTLSDQTGGQNFYSDGYYGSVGLSEAFNQILNSIDINQQAKQQIVSRKLEVNNTVEACMSVSIDNSLPKDLSFTFQWIHATIVTIEISQPNGTKWTPTAPSVRQSTTPSLKFDVIPEVGEWMICLNTQSTVNVGVQISVVGSPFSADKQNETGEDKPLPQITLETIIDNDEPDFLQMNERVKIFAIVRQGGTGAVIGATVEATISSDVKSETFLMLDNGSGADMIEDDGIYSLYIIKAANAGKHSVQVRVVGIKGQAQILDHQSYTTSVDQADDLAEPEEITNSFERAALAGFYDVVTASDETVDMIAPARIHDLRLVNVSTEMRYVTMKWTTVGDDFDQGIASEYLLLIANSVSDMLNKTYERVPQNWLKTGNLSDPTEPYKSETIQIWMHNRSITAFAVQARDDEGQDGPMSNILTVTVENLVQDKPVPSAANAPLVVALMLLLSCMSAIVL